MARDNADASGAFRHGLHQSSTGRRGLAMRQDDTIGKMPMHMIEHWLCRAASTPRSSRHLLLLVAGCWLLSAHVVLLRQPLRCAPYLKKIFLLRHCVPNNFSPRAW